MYLEARRCIFEKTCVVYLIVRPSVGRGLILEDVARGKRMYFEQTCDVYLIVRPSVSRELRLEARICILSNFVLFT